MPLTGFIFGLATVFLVLLFTQTMDSQMSNQTVVLVGMIMTLFVGAILTLITALFQDYLKQLVFWQMGSFLAVIGKNCYLLSNLACQQSVSLV